MKSKRNLAIQLGIITASILGMGATGISVYLLTPSAIDRRLVPSKLIALDSAKGQQLLAQSRAKQDYASLFERFQTQKLRAYCGVASAVMVVNALKTSSPPLTQDSFFTPAAQRIRSPYMIAFLGMSLEQLAMLLQNHSVRVKTQFASDTSLEQFRVQVRANLSNANDYVIVNYDRAALGQEGGGHISPIAAYHEPSDRILIADVSSYKYPSVWVSVSDLWQAMKTTDSTTRRSRGYLIARRW
ncbi:phytochelatin synthase family protein [Cyanobacteria bacterium FACHB-63]|nr:phytochelatin synthase family protein [Cyanobacteria bacterium FACHB-63]